MNSADAEQETLEVSGTKCALNLLGKDVPNLHKLPTPISKKSISILSRVGILF